MSKERVFAIANENENAVDNVISIAEKLTGYGIEASDIKIFTSFKSKLEGKVSKDIELVDIPSDKDNRPKRKNFIIKHLKELGFEKMHMIEDIVELLASPMVFIADIERMMDVYDLNNWLGTVTDACNYVYTKYNPRLDVVIDDEKCNGLGISNAIFCSHSNVQWIVCNLQKADDDELYFNEGFTIDMFFIIEFLARRRNAHLGSLYFMNQYYTCASEKGVYAIDSKLAASKDAQNTPEKMKDEDIKFKNMNVNYAPDNNIDAVLELLYQKIQSKLSA